MNAGQITKAWAGGTRKRPPSYANRDHQRPKKQSEAPVEPQAA